MSGRLDFSEKMRRIEMNTPTPTPEKEATVVRLLQRLGAEDLIPMLGLVVPQVINASSGSDSKLLV